MAGHRKRHLSFAGFIAALVLLIAAIFVFDAISRIFWQTNEENIIGTEGFSLESFSGETPAESPPEETTEPPSDNLVVTLSSADQATGSLILVDQAHPYAGSQNLTDFAANTNENVKPRETTLAIQTEILNPIGELFSAYATAQGWCNLQIDSTTDTSMSLYTNQLPDRSCGYGFDIGLITSTGEVVPYIAKRNEWMVENAWQYGFILRYPEDKTETTGVPYAPHHFRYVGKVHAALMHEKNYCLEEYLNFLQSYTFESGGLSYTDGKNNYIIYYVPMDASGTTTVEFPKDTVYTVSGDNKGGYIFTVSTDAAPSAPDNTDVPATTEPTT